MEELCHGSDDIDPQEKYYILHKENQVVQQLVEYTDNNTAAESTVIGNKAQSVYKHVNFNLHMCIALDDLYKHAQDMVTKATSSNSQISSIEAMLHINNDVDRDNCLSQGRSLAIQRKLNHFSAEMEMIYLYIQRKEIAIQSQASMVCLIIMSYLVFKCINLYTASSKQRANLRRSISGEKKKMEVCVIKYNNLAAMLPNTPCISVEMMLKGEFPWSSLSKY